MKNKLVMLLAAGALVVGAQQLGAVPITGTVDMSGTVFLDNTALGDADGATAFSNVTVGGIPTGSFTGTAGQSVAWSGFDWNPSNTPILPLWTFTAGTLTYSFDLNSVSVVSQDNFFLNLVGQGELSITGVGSPYEDTAGNWSFTISNPSGGAHANFAFTFANSQTAVPDGGATALLLGLGFLGLGAIARRK